MESTVNREQITENRKCTEDEFSFEKSESVLMHNNFKRFLSVEDFRKEHEILLGYRVQKGQSTMYKEI